MNIFGIGTDIINIKRIEKSLRKEGSKFKDKVFTKKEMLYCESKKKPSSYYAKRFAAKEAFVKALGTGFRHNITFKNIEVSNDNFGKPSIKIDGSVDRFLKKKIKNKKYKIYLSLSDDLPWAQATVIISHS
jgi:holo-[acyl-carrier protein] synthase